MHIVFQITVWRIDYATTAIRTTNTFGRTPIEMANPPYPTSSTSLDNQQIPSTTREYDWTLPTYAQLEEEYLEYGDEQGDKDVTPPLVLRKDL